MIHIAQYIELIMEHEKDLKLLQQQKQFLKFIKLIFQVDENNLLDLEFTFEFRGNE